MPDSEDKTGPSPEWLVHEVRNPLNAIKANLQLMEEDMLREEDGDGPHTRRVRRLLGEVARLDNILSDFLTFVREDETRFAQTDLSRLIEEVARFLTPQADAQNVVILADIPEGVHAEIDAEALRQALINLALNGLQAIEDRGTLMIRLASSDGFARIDMTDTGRGIPPERIDRIFDRFYTTREGGTGIGLQVVAKIVALHGGEIQCESEVQRGTSFRIKLPLTQSKPNV